MENKISMEEAFSKMSQEDIDFLTRLVNGASGVWCDTCGELIPTNFAVDVHLNKEFKLKGITLIPHEKNITCPKCSNKMEL